MHEGLVDTAAQAQLASDHRIYGVCVAEVIDNRDLSTLGRVQVRLPWLPGVEPWARVAAPAAGPECGAYWMPQLHDEVLVAFSQGDIREPYVVGCLWNLRDRPPARAPTDAVYKRIIRTPQGHEIVFDDLRERITITSSSGHKIIIEPEQIAISTADDTATVTLEKEGNVAIRANQRLALKAPQISVEAETFSLTGSDNVQIRAGEFCDIRGGTVMIN